MEYFKIEQEQKNKFKIQENEEEEKKRKKLAANSVFMLLTLPKILVCVHEKKL